ncbi:ATP-binding protein [Hydrogenimonas sp.]
METFNRLQYYSRIFLSSKMPKSKRDFYNEIDFSQKLIGIKGAKGIGKTTILHQYLNDIEEEKLYVSLDNPVAADAKLIDIIEFAFKKDIKVIAIDEIHYQKDFERDLKTAYDFFDIKILFSGSSAIALSNADLSRRAVVYEMPILSFREYIEFKERTVLEKFDLDAVVSDHETIAYSIIEKIKPLKHFEAYLKHGAYPFFLESDTNTYFLKLNEVVNKTIESDLLHIFHIDIANVQLLKKLLITLCQNDPGTLNMTSLSREIGINTRTLYNYITALQKGHLIHLLYYHIKGNALFQKPDKVLLDNPNLFQVLCSANKGGLRESFFVSQLYRHTLRYSKKGDFIIDDTYTVEVGGRNKQFKQIKGVKKSFVAADGIEVGSGNKIPLWLFGFLY